MPKRDGNRPDRRIAQNGSLDAKYKEHLASKVVYTGSALHKLHPGDYGFTPPQNPRPSKTPCDELRIVLLEEARSLFKKGIELGMVSGHPAGGVPKYVWAVDENGEVYEAKSKPGQEIDYHGYRLGDDDTAMRRNVLKEWKNRCR
jgi:hypothetical protein